jgi:hypothetical protein
VGSFCEHGNESSDSIKCWELSNDYNLSVSLNVGIASEYNTAENRSYTICFNSLTLKQLLLFSRPPLSCDFVDVGVTVSLPDSLLDVLLVVRAMLVKYDHFSDLCPSWILNASPKEEQKGTVPIFPLRNQDIKLYYCTTSDRK